MSALAQVPISIARQRYWFSLVLATGLLTMGCSSMGTDGGRGSGGASGPITWEVSDMGRIVSADNQRIRWSYVITIRNTGDGAVQLESVERAIFSSHPDVAGGTRTSRPYNRRIEARSELRYAANDDWGWRQTSPGVAFGGAAVLDAITAYRRFIGSYDRGKRIEIETRVRLDPSVGVLAKPPTKPQSLPVPTRLASSSDLASLVGSWRGSYRQDKSILDIPIEVTILPDGKFQVAENVPITNRFAGTVQVRDGGLAYLGNRDRGTLSLHEIAGRRMLVGQVAPSEGPTYAVYLEAQAPSTAAVSPASPRTAPTSAPAEASSSRSAGLPAAVQAAFEEYKADAKYTHFKAFAADRRSGAWGRSWGISSATAAMERALDECGKRGAACAVYAVGDTTLESVSAEQRAAIMLGGAWLTYKGLLTTDHEGRVETSPVIFYLFRGRTEITGSWSRDDPRISGVITGGVSDTNQATVQMTQSDPCRSTFSGTVSITDDAKTLDAAYSGSECDGVPLKATFRGTRQ